MNDNLLDVNQAAEFLGYTVQTMANMRSSGKHPYVKHRGRVYYRREDLEKIKKEDFAYVSGN